MKDQVLSIEQMQKLKELGVDVSNASMRYYIISSGKSCDGYVGESIVLEMSDNHIHHISDVPTFTLHDMIELMPNAVKIEDEEYYLIIDKNCTQYLSIEESPIYWNSTDNILINTYKVLLWLAEHKYI